MNKSLALQCGQYFLREKLIEKEIAYHHVRINELKQRTNLPSAAASLNDMECLILNIEEPVIMKYCIEVLERVHE